LSTKNGFFNDLLTILCFHGKKGGIEWDLTFF